MILFAIVAVISLSQLKKETKQATVQSTVSKTVAGRPSPLSPPPPQKLTAAQFAEKATPSVVVAQLNCSMGGAGPNQGRHCPDGVLEMRDLHELSMEEVAGKLGISIAAAKSRLLRARLELRRRLERHLDSVPA